MTDTTNPTLEAGASQVPAGVARSLGHLRFMAVADLVAQLRSQEPADRTTTANILEELNQERATLAADLAAQKARADAAERMANAKSNVARTAVKITDEYRAELLKAQTKVAKLVEALEFYADRSLDGYDVQVTDYGLSTERGVILQDGGDIARAAIAEVQTNRTTTPTEYERKVAQMKEDFPNGI